MPRLKDPIILGGIAHKTKVSADQAIKTIVNSIEDGVPIIGQDHAVILDLVRMHPSGDEKIGAGVDHFYVDRAPDYPSRCLWVKRVDGTRDHFSWKVALTITKAYPEVSAAGRTAILPTITRFRDSAFDGVTPVRCAVSGQILRREEAHVDHADPWTFVKIVAAFVASRPPMPLWHDGQRDFFEDPDDEAAFIAFHNERAVLRMVHAFHNTSTLQIGRKRKA